MASEWKSLTAGILDIISGVGMLFVCFWLVLAGGITSMVGSVPQWVPGLLFGLAVPLVILAVLAGVGGIFAIKRKVWGMALVGSIAAFLCCFLLGVISVILTAVSQNEFK